MKKCIKELIFRDNDFKTMKEYRAKSFKYPEIKVFANFRKAQYYCFCRNPLTRALWKWKWLQTRKKTHCQISLNATLGEGFRLIHDGVRVIVANVKIGKDCAIGVNVILGYNLSGKVGVPTIGDRVYIGHNSTIVGGITIGNNVLIAPNTFVNRDVPDHSIVLGNNVIIPKENPSEQYLKLY